MKKAPKNKLLGMGIALLLVWSGASLAAAPPPGPVTVIFDDMEHGNPFGNGWFAFGGSVGGGGIGPNSSDIPPALGGAFSLETGWGGIAPGFFGGFGRTNPVDLSGTTHFNFWINPDGFDGLGRPQDYTLEINLQDDDDGNGAADQFVDDEFQFNCVISPAGPCAVAGGGWQMVSIPLADFFDDNSFFPNGNGVLDAVPVSGGGNGQLINVVVAVISNAAADATFRTDYWAFTDPALDGDGDRVPDILDNCPMDFNPDQTDFNGDGVGDACTPCEPDPRSQGYWHRQCLGVPAADGGIDPGRNGRGPQNPLEEDFDRSMDAVSSLLEGYFEFDGACAGGMDADPPSDSCERALKQSSALLFNLVTSKLSGSCSVDLSAQGCSSTNLTDLVAELEGLINSGDEANCEIAEACADAVNEGTALESAAVNVVEAPQPLETAVVTTPGAVISGRKGHSVASEEVAPAEIDGPADAPTPSAPLPVIEPRLSEVETPATEVPQDTTMTLRQHLAVVANPSAPEKAMRVSADALLTALSGGYEPEVRIEIIRALLSRIDVAYHGLLAEHLEDIRAEAMDSGHEDLAGEAARILEQLELSER